MSAAVSASEASDGAASTARRKSGRVSKKPTRFAPASSPTGSAKRKRGENDDSGVDADEPSSEREEEESSESEGEGEPDPEELRDRQRKKKSNTPARKPATKKPKTNGQGLSLAIRPAANATRRGAKRSRKAPIRKSALPEETEGLYADVFASGDRLDAVTARWVARFYEHEGRSVAEIINLVLTATGCDVRINEDDIADPDNAPNRVAEIQEEYQTHEVTEYPLIAKAKDGGGQAFRNALHGFFSTLVQTVAQSGLLYDSPELIENISVWLGAMSSTGNRPFRHTSTVASLAITTALAQVAAGIVENTAKRMRQSEAESKKSRVNKARVSAADQEVDEYNRKLQIVESSLDDWFNVVYVHRYRDVDPRIRVDCVIALADWIIAYPDKFFDGTKLRYLGWVLSDPNPPTRVEVLHQLARLFRDENKLAGLKTFTERFRPRIVEIATYDAENNVRAAAVDLLNILREAGFLEPDDIDSVGKLIFDSDAKVRKSVVGFFAENVNAAYEALVDDMGGEEALNEALAPSDEDDEGYHNPRLEWLKLKCLVDQLLSYDEDEAELPSHIERISSTGAELGLIAAGVESRFSLAAQALSDAIPEIRAWEVLAGYLLYDHSQTIQNSGGDDAEAMLRQNCQLEEKHETALLGVLNAVVRLRLQRLAEVQKDKKKTRTQRESDKEDQADMARRLSLLIPQLLKKFGALPEAAALCLRLERELNLDVFQELRQNAALTALLDDINKQFLTHHNERVLIEAIESIMHAQGNDELKETVSLKVQSLWDDLLNTFDALRRGKDFATRGSLDQNILVGVSNVVLKMAQLAKASDAAVLDHINTPAKSKSKGKKVALDTPPISSVLQILDRGVLVDDLDAETEEAEDALVRHAMSVMLMYMLWKCRECATHVEKGTSMPDDELTVLVERRDACVTALMRIMASRKGADEVRLEAADLLLDIYTMFRTLKANKGKAAKTPRKTQGHGSNNVNDDWEALCRDIDGDTTKLIFQILTACENNLAKLANKRLEEPEVDDDPVDPDDEPESDDEDVNDERAISDKQLRILLAEQSLCAFGGRIVQAVHVGVLDSDGSDAVRKRLERNKVKLTTTWKEIVNHLDAVKQRKGAKKAVHAAKPPTREAKSKETVIEIDSDEEDEVEVQGDEIEDEEMRDDDAEQTNGVDDARENGDGELEGERDADEESILGD
ncbi:STAG-domain-containing protein [Cucurbitaria berberidis CBS 394.84]|uniref:STAG-domain-containing protein n=1 Tax=Cucurbitaria berberidis CBS 394.84 TaxID=1168544 RepID=A0A9P4GLC7_9PLEO|nr:STAG-domain-containing protein [Cucurbitaria berberidis CBS 394.84]KAF1847180.1 STAG-domain-containing protein [Cucurbitaria berberidis CBS 394.84]